MKRIYTSLSLLCSFVFAFAVTATAQNHWPKVVSTNDQDQVKMYRWEPESLTGNTLKARAAISLEEKGKKDLVFGMLWLTAIVNENNNQVIVESVQITNIKLPGVDDNSKLYDIQSSLESAISEWNLSFSSSELQQDLKANQEQKNLSAKYNNNPPKVIYTNRPSLLVYIDGTPKLQKNEEWGVETVVNSPYTIVKNNDGLFYLYGGNHWYTAPAATGSYRYTSSVPENLTKIEAAVDEENRKNNSDETDNFNDNIIPNIIISTEPAELIQSDGEANFSPIANTSLLYVSNSANDIFMDINSQNYFVLLSGRWYRAKTLKGQWNYIAADKLPEDFAKIPESSPKANVLSSVAGTDAAEEALVDAQVPHTAKVDRNNARANVIYDGDPVFEDIDGTDLEYATNTPASVIRWRGRYYVVDNGVWFESRYASGPWVVSVIRPYAVAYIPPRYPVYNIKYVYIYDVYPDYVYMGYTPGYLNTFIYGPTIVYGTGYYYDSWYDHYYYPRPCTWGFGMRYNPWLGWGFSLNINFGWFNYGYGYGYGYGYSWPYYGGGWWGPSIYRPSYCWSGYAGSPYSGVYGYYGRNYGYRDNNYAYSNYRTNNIYRNRTGVVTRDYQGRNNRPSRFGSNERPGLADNNENRNNNFRPFLRDRAGNNSDDNFNNNNNNRSDNRNYSERPTRQYREFDRTPNYNDNNRSNNNNRREWQQPSDNNSGGNRRERITREPRDYNNDGNRTPRIQPQPRQERIQPPARQERSSFERPRSNGNENNNSRPGRGDGSNNGRGRRG